MRADVQLERYSLQDELVRVRNHRELLGLSWQRGHRDSRAHLPLHREARDDLGEVHPSARADPLSRLNGVRESNPSYRRADLQWFPIY